MKMLVSLISYVRYTRGGVCDPEGQLSFLGEFWNPVQFSHSVVSDSETPRTAAHQASLSIPNSRSLLKLMSIELVMPSNHLILCHPFSSCLNLVGI